MRSWLGPDITKFEKKHGPLAGSGENAQSPSQGRQPLANAVQAEPCAFVELLGIETPPPVSHLNFHCS